MSEARVATPDPFELMRQGRPAVWLRTGISDASDLSDLIGADEVLQAQARLDRFAPVLKALFAEGGWDGRIQSELIDYPSRPGLLVKGDHALPLTGSIKARGGIYELLCRIEAIALEEGLISDDLLVLVDAASRATLARHGVAVASTGNLGFSIGLVSRAFGLRAQIHMSHDARAWKKERLRQLGAEVVEHHCDYSETVARARAAVARDERLHFIDDEASRDLFLGYATAGRELEAQLEARGTRGSADRPIVVYLPCGVGGAPGGISHGLKTLFGQGVVTVFVEPIASASMFAALATGRHDPPPSVYEIGLDNDTIADGLAVPRASQLVLDAVGGAIDAVVAVDDRDLVTWASRAWREAGLRLEPSAAAGFAAMELLAAAASGRQDWPDLADAVHIVWATGGSHLPESEFQAILRESAS